MGVLVDHEYVHEEDAKDGIKLKEGLECNCLNASYFNPRISLFLDELIAYSDTVLKSIKKRNFSELIKECVGNLEKLQIN